MKRLSIDIQNGTMSCKVEVNDTVVIEREFNEIPEEYQTIFHYETLVNNDFESIIIDDTFAIVITESSTRSWIYEIEIDLFKYNSDDAEFTQVLSFYGLMDGMAIRSSVMYTIPHYLPLLEFMRKHPAKSLMLLFYSNAVTVENMDNKHRYLILRDDCDAYGDPYYFYLDAQDNVIRWVSRVPYTPFAYNLNRVLKEMESRHCT